MYAHFALGFAEREAGSTLLNHEATDTRSAFPRLSARHQQVQIGLTAVSNPHLAAIDHVHVAAALRATLQAGSIGASFGFAQRERSSNSPAARRGTQRRRCSSLPKRASEPVIILWTERPTAVAISPLANCS